MSKYTKQFFVLGQFLEKFYFMKEKKYLNVVKN